MASMKPHRSRTRLSRLSRLAPIRLRRATFANGCAFDGNLWISGSLMRHSSPLFWFALTFPLGLRLAMIQRFILKAQRVAVFGGGLGT